MKRITLFWAVNSELLYIHLLITYFKVGCNYNLIFTKVTYFSFLLKEHLAEILESQGHIAEPQCREIPADGESRTQPGQQSPLSWGTWEELFPFPMKNGTRKEFGTTFSTLPTYQGVTTSLPPLTEVLFCFNQRLSLEGINNQRDFNF